MTLRPYQQDAHDAVMTEFETVQSTAVVHATGLGKTNLACEIIKSFSPKRALFLAHRRELVHQAAKRIQDVTGISCEVDMAGDRADATLFGRSRVVVASVQTQYSGEGKRLFDPNTFGLVICDELHHYTGAPAFRNVIRHYLQNPNLKLLGLTATPNRTDGKAMGILFESVAHSFELIDACREGWLCKPLQIFVPVGSLDYSHVRTTAGDLNGADLAAVLDEEENVAGMIMPTLEIAHGADRETLKTLPVEKWGDVLTNSGLAKTTIIFCATVHQADRFAAIINRVTPNSAAMVCDKTHHKERERILTDFASGRLRFVANVGILGEGYDNPKVEIVVQARPTESLCVYQQQIGRATRTLPGTIDGLNFSEQRLLAIKQSEKPNALVVDFVGNSGRHRLINCADMLGGDFDEEAVERAIKKAQSERNPVDFEERVKEEQERIDAERKQRQIEEAARKAKIVAKVSYSRRFIDPFDAFSLKPHHERPWEHGKQLSEKQRALLLKQGVNVDDMSYTQGKQVLNELFRRWKQGGCSIKQAALLKKHGYDGNMTREQASKTIDALAKNGWKRPAEPMAASPAVVDYSDDPDNCPF